MAVGADRLHDGGRGIRAEDGGAAQPSHDRENAAEHKH